MSKVKKRTLSKQVTNKSQDDIIGEWLNYLENCQKRNYPRFKKDKSNQKDFEEKEDKLWKKTMKIIESGKNEGSSFFQFVKDNNLNQVEIKIILSLYLGYLKEGYNRGETLLSILNDVTRDFKTAYLERKNMKERGVLFSSKVLVKEEGRNPFRRGENIYTLSPELLSILEGEEIVIDEEDSNSYLFEIIEPKKTLDDVVLTKDARRKIEIVLKQMKNYDLFMNEWGFGEKLEKGKGLILMFYGPSGTGKTLTAEGIAHHLKRKLYVVSLPDVLNPFFGVTEKNIKRVFEIAKEEECVLLLDEVDAFISSRSKGGTYMDSHHNREVSLFLRLIEDFEGIATLTTNLPDVIDFALQRRVSMKLEFPKPDITMRKKLWEILIPEELPLSPDVDFDKLARDYNITGGEIKNVIMNAARLSLFRGNPIVTQEDFIQAAESENIKEKDRAGFVSA